MSVECGIYRLRRGMEANSLIKKQNLKEKQHTPKVDRRDCFHCLTRTTNFPH